MQPLFRLTLIAIALMLITATSASAWTLEWEPVGQTAAGGSTQAGVAAIGGVPYATWVDGGIVRVSRLASDGSWQPVGGALNHDPAEPASSPHLADIDGTPWITWAERDATGTGQLRVARLTGGSWQEVVGGDQPVNRFPSSTKSAPLFTAYEGRLASFGGRVYLAFREDNGSDISAFVSRLSSDGSSWEPVGTAVSHSARGSIGIVVSGGQLYVGYDALPGGVYASRLNAAGDGFSQVGTSVTGTQPDGSFVALSDAGGTLEVLWTKQGPSAQLSKLATGDTWVGLTADTDIPGAAASVTQAGGLTYVASIGTDQLAHVTFFNGSGWEQAPDPSTQVKPASPPSLTTVAGEPYVGYAHGADECVARLDDNVDSTADDDLCGPAFPPPTAAQQQQPPATGSEQPAGDSSQPSTASDEPVQSPVTPSAACRVPRLRGKSLRTARIALARAHCSIGRVSHHRSSRMHRGRVIRSLPIPGTLLADGAPVRLVVAR